MLFRIQSATLALISCGNIFSCCCFTTFLLGLIGDQTERKRHTNGTSSIVKKNNSQKEDGPKMMRIKEAIQRRKLIQQLNDEYIASQIDSEPHQHGHSAKLSCSTAYGSWATPPAPGGVGGEEGEDADSSHRGTDFVGLAENQEAYISLAQFVSEFNGRLSDGHRRALRVTWNRLSEPPKTSGRGVLKIMEKIFQELINKNPEMKNCFYRSAFIKCLEDRKRNVQDSEAALCPIVTIRDHAHLLIELIDGIMCVLFDVPRQKPIWDPVAIGRVHARLIPCGFEKEIWHSLGAIFAEVMFCQECVRAYPLAASAWSMLSVALTDRMFRHTKLPIVHQFRSVSLGNTGDWSQQSSMNAESSALLHNLSADLQKKAMISLRGSGHLGSTASSFRRDRQEHENVKQKRLAEQQQSQQQKRRSLVATTSGWKSQERPRLTTTISAKRRQSSSEERRIPPPPHSGGNGGAKHPTLEKTPSFFSRTIASWTGPMPSSRLSSLERRSGGGHAAAGRRRSSQKSRQSRQSGQPGTPAAGRVGHAHQQLQQMQSANNARKYSISPLAIKQWPAEDRLKREASSLAGTPQLTPTGRIGGRRMVQRQANVNQL